MSDAKGEDEKILAVPVTTRASRRSSTLDGLHEHWQREIATFFRTYKELQGELTDVRGWADVEEAWRVIEVSRQRYESR